MTDVSASFPCNDMRCGANTFVFESMTSTHIISPCSPSRQKALAASGHARSVESMFAFSDEGGGEGLDLQPDLDHLVYAKIPEFDTLHTANSSARGSLLHGSVNRLILAVSFMSM